MKPVQTAGGTITAADILENRNRHVGSLLAAERAAVYVEIMLALMRFRDNHELEPLHDDVLAAVAPEPRPDGDGDHALRFNQDMRQLLDWELVTQRIEKERLRGYRDTRRRKFRYRIADEAASFMLWLEARRQDDLQPDDDDARDLLADVVSSLHEMERALNKTAAGSMGYEEARAVFHRLAKAAATTEAVARSLGDFNLRLLSFVGGTYDIPRARQIIAELERFLQRFLRRIALLRNEVEPQIDKLAATRLAARWETCTRIMAEEVAATQSIMRTRAIDPARTLARLADFYRPGGRLEQLTSRVSGSAILVWRRLEAHLRELERRSHRLEDVRARILDMSRFAPTSVPHTWLQGVIQPGQMVGDMHEWNERLKAAPPQPAWARHQIRTQPRIWLTPRKPAGEAPVQSLEETRLEVLAEWMRARGIMPEDDGAVLLSAGGYGKAGDFPQIMEVMRNGLLGGGRRLAAIGAAAEPTATPASVTADGATLAFNDISLRKADDDEDHR